MKAQSAASKESAFLPDVQAALSCDRRMQNDLADSLKQLLQQLQEQLPATRIARYTAQTRTILDLVAQGERVSPGAFAAYYRAVLALLQGDETSANLAFELLHECAVPMSQLQIRDLSPAGLGSETKVELYRRALDTDSQLKFGFHAPEAAASERCRQSIERGLGMMDGIAPALAGEFRALVGEILLAAPNTEPGSMRFDGVSSYQLWGALTLSVEEQKSDLEMMETLAHEAAHSFLFGLMAHETLVTNADDDLYASPLRSDPRPMDGIFHATFVSARMHYAMQVARDSDKLTASEQHQCQEFLAASRKAFNDGYSVVADKADMTATGYAIMQSAVDYMTTNTD